MTLSMIAQWLFRWNLHGKFNTKNLQITYDFGSASDTYCTAIDYETVHFASHLPTGAALMEENLEENEYMAKGQLISEFFLVS